MPENIFEIATREKIRFETSRGEIGVEELWDVPLTSKNQFDLDNIAKAVNKKIKDQEEESFVKVKSAESNTLKLKLEVVKRALS